ncbi:MAG: class I SAM-dependent methyltransferase [Minisyncoccia bacterium]
MSQEKEWDREYKRSKLLTLENKPQADVVRFVRWLRKTEKVDLEHKSVLDLGSGTGRNSFYFAELGSKVVGFEISQTAITIAKENFKKIDGLSYDISYDKKNIGERFYVVDESVDIVLDVTSSNSLNENEREVCLSETSRVLRSQGYFFVKAMCKDGDLNAKHLLKTCPGQEKDTYILPDLGVTERVWSREDFIKTYDKYFKILYLEKKSSYSKMNNRSYKRNFWICYMEK